VSENCFLKDIEIMFLYDDFFRSVFRPVSFFVLIFCVNIPNSERIINLNRTNLFIS